MTSPGSPSRTEVSHGCCYEFLVMYRITVSASRLTAYNPESGSCSETRQTPSRLSQNAVQDRCSARNAATRAAASGVGRLIASLTIKRLVHLVHLVHATDHLFHLVN